MTDLDDVESRLFGVETNIVGLVKVMREIVATLGVIVAGARTGEALPSTELDEIMQSLDELHQLLARVSEFLPDVGD